MSAVGAFSAACISAHLQHWSAICQRTMPHTSLSQPSRRSSTSSAMSVSHCPPDSAYEQHSAVHHFCTPWVSRSRSVDLYALGAVDDLRLWELQVLNVLLNTTEFQVPTGMLCEHWLFCYLLTVSYERCLVYIQLVRVGRN